MNATERYRLLGVLLCGGKSKRMGRDKAMLDHPAGGTYWSHAVDRLRPVCQHICLVGDHRIHRDPNFPTDIDSLVDEVTEVGPLGGVITGLRFATAESFDAALITPIDVPYLRTADLNRLRECGSAHPEQVIAARSESGRDQPLIAIYPVTYLDALSKLARGTDRSVLRWLQTQTYRSLTLSDASCRNINTPEDIEHGS